MTFVYQSCIVLASSKDITAFMKTRQLKLLLAANIEWPRFRLKIRLSFREFYLSKPLPYELLKKASSFFLYVFLEVRVLIIITYFLRQLLDHCRNFFISIIQNHCCHIFFKKIVFMSTSSFFVHCLLWLRA